MPDHIESLLKLNLSLTVAPAIIVTSTGNTTQVVFEADPEQKGFACMLEAALPYETLGRFLNGSLHGKRIPLTEGLLRRHIVIERCGVHSSNHHLTIAIKFSGSFTGTIFLTGRPYYNLESRQIELQQVGYDLKTNSFFLRGAKWLFGNQLLNELKKYTSVDMTTLYSTATSRLQALLNQQWTAGITVSGHITALHVTGVFAQPHQLLFQGYCDGSLRLEVPGFELKL